MGRRKGYDRQELIERATELFRDFGFAGTSTALLVGELGVNKNSLYSEFGSKQALFDECLHHYNSTNVENNFGPLETPKAGLKEIRDLFDFFARAASGPAVGRGCLFCNTAVEFGPADPTGQRFVESYFRRIHSSFENALKNARATGELPSSVDLKSEAQAFTASVLGLFVMLRAKAKPAMVKGAAAEAKRRLDALTS